MKRQSYYNHYWPSVKLPAQSNAQNLFLLHPITEPRPTPIPWTSVFYCVRSCRFGCNANGSDTLLPILSRWYCPQSGHFLGIQRPTSQPDLRRNARQSRASEGLSQMALLHREFVMNLSIYFISSPRAIYLFIAPVLLVKIGYVVFLTQVPGMPEPIGIGYSGIGATFATRDNPLQDWSICGKIDRPYGRLVAYPFHFCGYLVQGFEPPEIFFILDGHPQPNIRPSAAPIIRQEILNIFWPLCQYLIY